MEIIYEYEQPMEPRTLRDALRYAINRHSAENGSNTPDYVLARYLELCLEAFDAAVGLRDKHYCLNLFPGCTGLDEELSAIASSPTPENPRGKGE